MQPTKIWLAGAVLALTAALALYGAPRPAQNPPSQEPLAQGGVIRSQVRLVNIFATVRGKNKNIVTGLKQEDFRVFEDGKEEKIAFFSQEVALPITLGMLIDTSGSEQNRLMAEQEAAGRFLNRVLRKGDLAMVFSFDSDVDMLSDFTDDRAQLESAIRRARVNVPSGMGPIAGDVRSTAFYDAVYLASSEKLAGEAGRKALVIITDADDQGSKVRLEEAIEAAQRNDTVVHILLVHDSGYGFRPDVAHKLTEETGGRSIEVSSEKRIEEAFDQISEELRTQYTLGYYPTNASKDGKYRKIKVEMADKSNKVLTRKGYYPPRN
jgi:VWFA-related protein